MTIFPPHRPSCTFKGLNSEQEKLLEESRLSHLKQIDALQKLSFATIEEIVDNVMTFGPKSHYGIWGGVNALKKYAFPPDGTEHIRGEHDRWSRTSVTPEESKRCWQILSLFREHPKSENATKELVYFFAKHLKHANHTHYEFLGFPEEAEKGYLLAILTHDNDSKLSFLVDVLEHHMGNISSQSVIQKVTDKLLEKIDLAKNKAQQAQEILDLLQKQTSSKGIPDELFKKIQTNLYPC